MSHHPRISKTEFEHLSPRAPGRIRVQSDHDGCSGESKNLLIERSDYGVSCYCFRCGGRGFYYLDPNYQPAKERHEARNGSFVRTDSGISLPADTCPALEGASREAREWLAKGGILGDVIAERGFLWSHQEQALYIPVQQDRSAFGPVLRGYAKRGFSPKSYRTIRTASDALWGLYRGEGGRGVASEGVCLVEDVLSGLRVSPVMDALALCGTGIQAEALSFILTEGYKHAILFLDADNPVVRIATRKLARKLSWLPVRVVETGKDPKHYSQTELEKLLCTSQS